MLPGLKPKRKKKIQSELKDSWICRRFEPLPSWISWRVMVLQSSANMWIKGKPCRTTSANESLTLNDLHCSQQTKS